MQYGRKHKKVKKNFYQSEEEKKKQLESQWKGKTKNEDY